MDAVESVTAITDQWYLIACILVCGLVCSVLLFSLARLLLRRRLARRDMVWFEITPPLNVERTNAATRQFFSVIHSMLSGRRLHERLIGQNQVMSLEIVSSKSQGIRFLLQVERRQMDEMYKMIASYLPDCRVRVDIDQFLSHPDQVVTFRQSAHHTIPISPIDERERHDSLGYLTGALAKLEEDQELAVQLIISPIKTTRRVPVKDDRYGKDTSADIILKSTQRQFLVDLRLLAYGQMTKQRLAGITSVLNSIGSSPHQALIRKRSITLLHTNAKKLASSRLPSLWHRSRMILSTLELAALYHFPPLRISQTDNLQMSLSKSLPAPTSMKSGRPFSVIIGENRHHGQVTPIGLTESERERHMYVVGGTGNGKTTLLLGAILQDIRAGRGVAVIDPHGDLAETILGHIPKQRIDDVIYLNPDDLERPIGVNLLELPDGITGDELLREKDLVTESIVSVMRKTFSTDDIGGHRVEYILRNAIQTALTVPGSNLFTIFRLMNDSKFRRPIVKALVDKDLKDFWENELGRAGDYQRVKMAAGITSKIGRFLFSASARGMLEQEKSTIDFDDIMASGKILICNFSKGLVGEDTSALFGTTVLAKLQLAALRRARTDEKNRRSFYLYVDEFQNFATMSFVQMLSEARKYKLLLTMAEQSTAQQEHHRLVDIILANVGTVVCFRSGSPADERAILPLFSPFISPGEIANLPAYNFYIRIAAIETNEPMSGVTILEKDDGDSDTIRNAVIKKSRFTYSDGKRVASLDKEQLHSHDNQLLPYQTRPATNEIRDKVFGKQP